jgi:hypothetical protein
MSATPPLPPISPDCEKVLSDIESRGKDAELAQAPVFNDFDQCKFYHFINNELFWESDQEKPDRTAFHDWGLSVFVEGGLFGPLDLAREIRIFRRKRNWKSIGVVRFEASDILDQQKFNFRVKHDPHKYRDKTGLHRQAKNHAQIVCKKNSTARQSLLQHCEPMIKPGDVVQEQYGLEKLQQALKTKKLAWIALFAAAMLLAISKLRRWR